MLPVSEVSTGSARVVEWTMACVATSTKVKTMARWPRVGEVPYQALPSPSFFFIFCCCCFFFAYKIARAKRVRKGEGEPGDEATPIVPGTKVGI